MKNTSTSRKVFVVFNTIFMILIGIVTLYPFWYTIVISLSDFAEVTKTSMHLYTASPTLEAYRNVLSDSNIAIGYGNTLFKVIVGTTLSTLVSAMMAYALAHKDMYFKRFFSILITIGMIFSGGIVPTYILIKNLGLINNRLVYILPALISSYNVIIMKSSFKSVPAALSEAAKIDGCNEFVAFFKIVLPVSKATIATIALWNAVGLWNSWMDGLLYITDNNKQILQIFLQRTLSTTAGTRTDGATEAVVVASESTKAASIVVTMLPILCVYPFVQRYFVKGVTIGAVKG